MRDIVRSKAVFVLPFLFFLFGAIAYAQPAFQVADLNTARSGGILSGLDGEYVQDSFAALGGTVFFAASDGIHGVELWQTDGSEAGTRLVADVCPGSCASIPRNITAAGGWVYFMADDGLHRTGLWKSDGTPAGTSLVWDRTPSYGYYGYSWYASLRELNGLLLFSFSDFHYRHELWRSDGTAEGTFLLLKHSTGRPLAQLGEKLLFSAGDRDHGFELWVTDGTPSGTYLLKDIAPGPQSSSPGDPGPFSSNQDYRTAAALAGGRVFFSAQGSEGFELWASDGTEAGTVLVKDIVPGSWSSYPYGLAALGGKLFFFIPGSSGSRELWTSDGTAGGTLKVVQVAYGASRPTTAGGRFFFTQDCELWTSDGTPAGTVQVKLFPGPGSLNCYQYDVVPFGDGGGELLFTADDGIHGRELWKSDGTPAGTTLVADLYPGSSSSSYGIEGGILAGGRVYFRAKEGDEVGAQLWTSDGTAAGTRMLRVNHQESGFSMNARGELAGPRPFFDLDGTLLFQGSDGLTETDLWKSDGTAGGTAPVADLPGARGLPAAQFTRVGDTVFFVTPTDYVDRLWATDGTPEGTRLLSFYAPPPYSYEELEVKNLSPVGDVLLFSYEDLQKSDGTPHGTTWAVTSPRLVNPWGVESIVSRGDLAFFNDGSSNLWTSDGTEEGTARLLSFQSPPRLGELRDGVLLFAGTTPETGQELWRSDGTAAGTYLLAETVPGPGSKPLGPFALAGSTLFFMAGGHELWKNDAAGTSLVRTLPAMEIRSLTPAGRKVYFVYDDGEHGLELWVSDGTEAGTRLVEDVLPGPASSRPRQLHAEGGLLLFSATDGTHGVEPWRSDGTALGTRMLQDIAPGALPSSPVGFTASGPNVCFAANDGTSGFELWAFPRPALLATFADVATDHWAWRFVEALVTSGLTTGCGGDRYCPDLPVKRAEAAAFLVRAAHGSAFVPPPATGTVFQDVPAGHWAAPWIEQLAADGVTSGCGGGNFCPADPLTRAEVAVLLLKARHGSGFVPPPATGTVFHDIPASHWAAPWIEKLAADGITGGCGGGNYCPARTVTRAEMATFLAKTFGLVLP
jgi:ELWxxDGT repeat protein